MNPQMLKKNILNGLVLPGLLLILSGCAPLLNTASTASSNTLRTDVPVVEAGDTASVHYVCNIKKTGDLMASTQAPLADAKAASVFFAPKTNDPVSLRAVRPEEPLSVRFWQRGLDVEIQERLARMVTGMNEGERRRFDLVAQKIQPQDEQSGIVRLNKARPRSKEQKMPRGQYEFIAKKAPEAGQIFAYDPVFPGRVEAVSADEVLLKYEAEPGKVVQTPWGKATIRDDGSIYRLDIDAKEGALVRINNTIGRITSVTDKVITVDNRHPFGYEDLACDVTVVSVRKTAAAEAKGHESKSQNGGEAKK